MRSSPSSGDNIISPEVKRRSIDIDVIEEEVVKNEFEDFENEFNVKRTNSPDMIHKQVGSFVSDNEEKEYIEY